jgi:hypothetical protein
MYLEWAQGRPGTHGQFVSLFHTHVLVVFLAFVAIMTKMCGPPAKKCSRATTKFALVLNKVFPVGGTGCRAHARTRAAYQRRCFLGLQSIVA